MQQKIVPNIWFQYGDGRVAPIINYYQKVFAKYIHADSVIPLGETPSGYAEMCNIELFGSNYMLMNTAEAHHELNDAISFVIQCENQDEIDKYWNYFTKDGQEAPCGWCIDKLGLRWQIVPANMGELMGMPNAGKVLMSQKRIIIAEYGK